MKHVTTVATLTCGIALALPALAPARTETHAVQVTVKLNFQAPQRISGKVSSPFPGCRANRRVKIQASDGSASTEFVTDGAGVFHGRPSAALKAQEDYRVKVFRSVANRSGHRHVCAGVVVPLGEQPQAGQAR
jgi:hypothetical protein